MKLVQEKGRYQLESPLSATLEEYLHMLEVLTEKLDLRDVEYVNDYDSYYHSFYFNDLKISASYNNFLGIWIFIASEISIEIQKDTLERLAKVISS